MNLDIKRVVGYRQFCNKLWNAMRFALTYITDVIVNPQIISTITSHLGISSRDLFILSRLNTTIRDCNQYLHDYNFGGVTTTLYSFFLYDVCDVYLELIKPIVTNQLEENTTRREAAQLTLFLVIEHFLRLSHPMMPFVTEELWQRLPNLSSFTNIESIMISSYPEEINNWTNDIIELNMNIVKEAIHGARSLRADYKILNHIKAEFGFTSSNNNIIELFMNHHNMDFCTLAKGISLIQLESNEIPKGWCVKVISDSLSLYMNLNGILDIDMELIRLKKEIERLTPSIESLKRKMNVNDYETKVPENVRLANSEKLNAMEIELKATILAKESFDAMKQ